MAYIVSRYAQILNGIQITMSIPHCHCFVIVIFDIDMESVFFRPACEKFRFYFLHLIAHFIAYVMVEYNLYVIYVIYASFHGRSPSDFLHKSVSSRTQEEDVM